jgi:hypothetical protein
MEHNLILDTTIEAMVKGWPSAILARTEVERFTGGMMNPKYQANLDSLGKGPERIRIGRKIGYMTRTYADWLKSKAAVVEKREIEPAA